MKQKTQILMSIKYPTVFCDIDGSIFKYRKFETYTTSEAEVLPNVVECMKKWYEDNVHIVLTTARPESLRIHTIIELEKNDIPYHQLVMGIERGARYLINDSEDPSIPRAFAFPIERDKGFDYNIK